jgi:hypothetical protein
MCTSVRQPNRDACSIAVDVSTYELGRCRCGTYCRYGAYYAGVGLGAPI